MIWLAAAMREELFVSGEARKGVGEIVPVDLFIPGCPPHPATILDGLLRLIGKLKKEGAG